MLVRNELMASKPSLISLHQDQLSTRLQKAGNIPDRFHLLVKVAQIDQHADTDGDVVRALRTFFGSSTLS